MPLTERCNLVRTYTSLIGYGAIRLRQAALLAITGIVFCLALDDASYAWAAREPGHLRFIV